MPRISRMRRSLITVGIFVGIIFIATFLSTQNQFALGGSTYGVTCATEHYCKLQLKLDYEKAKFASITPDGDLLLARTVSNGFFDRSDEAELKISWVYDSENRFHDLVPSDVHIVELTRPDGTGDVLKVSRLP
jgi:hypothetical protein